MQTAQEWQSADSIRADHRSTGHRPTIEGGPPTRDTTRDVQPGCLFFDGGDRSIGGRPTTEANRQAADASPEAPERRSHPSGGDRSIGVRSTTEESRRPADASPEVKNCPRAEVSLRCGSSARPWMSRIRRRTS
jgi:hypothetical protein